ncbi:hypothetical protein MIR68_000841 [Amoeboaphelidium protococcarum]|nr:hypothetical protein MIR68_000841 [Amoeboaphelidium protococcarum]
MTLIDLNSKQDLYFVLNNVKKRMQQSVNQHSLSGVSLVHLEQALKDLMTMVSQSCSINGHKFHEVSDQILEQFEPVQEDLKQQVESLKRDYQELTIAGAVQREQLLKQLVVLLEKDLASQRSLLQESTDVEKGADSTVLPQFNQKLVQLLENYGQHFTDAAQKLDDDNEITRPKLERYHNFIQEEIIDEQQYREHVDRIVKGLQKQVNQQRIPTKAPVEDQDSTFEMKLMARLENELLS